MELHHGERPATGRMTSVEGRAASRRRPMRRALAAGVVMAALIAALPGPALGQTQNNQRFKVVSAGPPGAARTVIATGVITGVGSEVITSNPVSGTAGAVTLRWTFPEGTLFVTGTYSFTNVLDPRSCRRTITLRGTWEITGGTGEFAGATGSGDFSGTNRIVLQRSNGSCVPPPVVLVQVFHFTGNVSLGGAAAA